MNPHEFAGGLYVIPGAVTPYPMKPRSDEDPCCWFLTGGNLPPPRKGYPMRNNDLLRISFNHSCCFFFKAFFWALFLTGYTLHVSRLTGHDVGYTVVKSRGQSPLPKGNLVPIRGHDQPRLMRVAIAIDPFRVV